MVMVHGLLQGGSKSLLDLYIEYGLCIDDAFFRCKVLHIIHGTEHGRY